MLNRRMMALGLTGLSVRTALGDSEHIHSVTVVSGLGDAIHLEETGLTVFQGQNQPVLIEGWNIDQHVRSKIEDLLPSTLRIVPSSAELQIPSECESIEACTARLPRSPDVDAYILVLNDESIGFSVRDHWAGVGLFHVGGPFSRFKAVLHAIYLIAVIDAKTGHVLQSEQARLPETVFGGEHAKPIKELDATAWPADAPMSPAQKNAVSAAATELIDQSLAYTLTKLRL